MIAQVGRPAQHGSSAQHSAAQRSTAQHGTARHSIARHGTARHITAWQQSSPAYHNCQLNNGVDHLEGALSYGFGKPWCLGCYTLACTLYLLHHQS